MDDVDGCTILALVALASIGLAGLVFVVLVNLSGILAVIAGGCVWAGALWLYWQTHKE